MHEDRRAKQLARLEEMQKRTEERMEAQRQRVNERFARAKRRLAADERTLNEDQQRIINAALDLLDEVGLQELSLRKLAAKLDLKAPALYWHFKNKEALIDNMAETILRSEFADLAIRTADETWQDWLVNMCRRLRKAMLAHRDGARVVAGAHVYPAITLMRLLEAGLESLTSAGVERKHASLIIMTAVHFVFGNVIEEQASPSLEEIKHLDLEQLAQEFPLVSQDLAEMIEAAQAGHDEFEDAIRLIVGNA